MTRLRDALKIVQEFFPEVTAVVDAKKNARIEVTNNDRNKAERLSHKMCAMAVACRRAMNLDGVIVSAATVYLVKHKTATRYHLPPSVGREVTSFDRGAGFAPGEYELSRPSPGRRLGERPSGSSNSKHSGSAKKPKHYTTGIRTILGSKMRRHE